MHVSRARNLWNDLGIVYAGREKATGMAAATMAAVRNNIIACGERALSLCVCVFVCVCKRKTRFSGVSSEWKVSSVSNSKCPEGSVGDEDTGGTQALSLGE